MTPSNTMNASAAAQELVLGVNSAVAMATRAVERASLIVDLEVLGGSTMKGMLKATSFEVCTTVRVFPGEWRLTFASRIK
jgi:hypothetical protein